MSFYPIPDYSSSIFQRKKYQVRSDYHDIYLGSKKYIL